MSFLLRMIFWIGLVLVLLPFGLKGTDGQDVSLFDAFGAAQAVVADARGFCSRQPEACAVGGQMVSHLAEKAQAGAQWLSEALGEHGAALQKQTEGRTASGAGASGGTPAPEAFGLTPGDLAPVWGHGEKVPPAGHSSSGAAQPAATTPERAG